MKSKLLSGTAALALGLIIVNGAMGATMSPSTDVLLSANGGVADINGSASGGFSTVASNLIDGNRDGIYGDGSTVHSASNPAGNYVEVTLASAVAFTSVNLFNRTDACCGGRIDGGGAVPYTLTIYNGTPGPTTIAFTENLTFTPTITDTNVSGQAITLPTYEVGNVVRITENNADYLNLAELEAFTPEPGSLALLACGAAGLLARRRARA